MQILTLFHIFVSPNILQGIDHEKLISLTLVVLVSCADVCCFTSTWSHLELRTLPDSSCLESVPSRGFLTSGALQVPETRYTKHHKTLNQQSPAWHVGSIGICPSNKSRIGQGTQTIANPHWNTHLAEEEPGRWNPCIVWGGFYFSSVLARTRSSRCSTYLRDIAPRRTHTTVRPGAALESYKHDIRFFASLRLWLPSYLHASLPSVSQIRSDLTGNPSLPGSRGCPEAPCPWGMEW